MKSIILFVLLALPFGLQAEVTADIARCAKISEKNDRLDCYDTVAAYYKKHGTIMRQVAPTAPANTTAPQNQSFAAVAPAAPATNKEDSFGRIVKQTSSVDSIKSNIVGEFKGWIKGAVLELSNGQKWKVTSSSTGYVKMQDPEVEISKGFFGSFKMKVKGLNAAAKVKRID